MKFKLQFFAYLTRLFILFKTLFINKYVMYIIIFILLFFLHFYFLSEFHYCADAINEARDALLAKISAMEDNVKYFSEQAKETDLLYKESLRYNLPEDIKAERLLAKKETETNLNVERKVLRILKNRLSNGDFDSSMSTSSTLGKRERD